MYKTYQTDFSEIIKQEKFGVELKKILKDVVKDVDGFSKENILDILAKLVKQIFQQLRKDDYLGSKSESYEGEDKTSEFDIKPDRKTHYKVALNVENINE